MTKQGEITEDGRDLARLQEEVNTEIKGYQFKQYVLIGLVIVISLCFCWQQIRQQFGRPIQLESLFEAILCAGIVALVLAIVNDFFLMKMEELRTKSDRYKFAGDFAGKFFAIHAESRLADEALQIIMMPKKRSPLVARVLASKVIADPDSRNSDLTPRVEKTYFYPVEHPPRFRDYTSRSRLTEYNPKTGRYNWSCTRSMNTIRTVNEYRIFLCSKSDLEAEIAQSYGVADAVFTLSEFSPQIAQKWFQDLRDNGFTVWSSDGSMTQIPVDMECGLDKMKPFQGKAPLTEKDGAFCRFFWSADQPGNQIEMSFVTQLSLDNDPFIYDSVHEFAFVNFIEIDYSGIKDHCGDVSRILFVRGPGCTAVDQNGLFTVKVSSALAGPGDGAVLIFRPGAKPQASPASAINHDSN